MTDISLTKKGEEQVKKIGHRLVGDGREGFWRIFKPKETNLSRNRAVVVEPRNLCTVLVSPRQRAHRTFHLLFEHTGVPNHALTEEVQEWDYGMCFEPCYQPKEAKRLVYR